MVIVFVHGHQGVVKLVDVQTFIDEKMYQSAYRYYWAWRFGLYDSDFHCLAIWTTIQVKNIKNLLFF